MTAADVNVTEMVARALLRQQTNGLCDLGRVCDLCDCFAHVDGGQARDARALAEASGLLDALRSPEVVAGIAGVLGAHGVDILEGRTFNGPNTCLCGALMLPDVDTHQAQAVVDWLAGGAR